MKISLDNNRAVHVGFRYSDDQIWQMTYVTLDLVVESNPLTATQTSTGFAQRNPNDAPNKLIGRKVALARALNELKLNRKDRMLVWVGLMRRGFRMEAKGKKRKSLITNTPLARAETPLGLT